MFFLRLSQRIVHYLTTATPDGILYAVDTRLRPHGKDGMLACSLDAFENYQRYRAAVQDGFPPRATLEERARTPERIAVITPILESGIAAESAGLELLAEAVQMLE